MSRPARRPQIPSAAVVEPLEPRRLLTFYRVTTADDVVADDGAISLREALEASNGNVAVGDAPAGQADAIDVIRIDPALRRADGAARFVGRVDVSDSLVLLASGVTFGGADRFRVFDVRLGAGEQFVLDSAVVRDGRGQEDFGAAGGGLRFAGPFEDPEAQIGDTAADPTARLGLRGVRFLYNGATGDNFVGGVGGALSTLGGAVVIRDSAFVSNSSDMGGAAAIESFTVRITDTVFQRNSATRGGAPQRGGRVDHRGPFPRGHPHRTHPVPRQPGEFRVRIDQFTIVSGQRRCVSPSAGRPSSPTACSRGTGPPGPGGRSTGPAICSSSARPSRRTGRRNSSTSATSPAKAATAARFASAVPACGWATYCSAGTGPTTGAVRSPSSGRSRSATPSRPRRR